VSTCSRTPALYVGKADVLRDRIRSYFGPSLDVRHVRLVERAERLEYVLTGSVSESYLLEANLIKQHRPRYNIRLKDDKSYPYVKVTLGEDFPRILRTRQLGDRTARYFGPYANAKSVDESLDLLQKLFPYRTCKLTITAAEDGRGRTVPPTALPGGRPCLLFHLKRCTAPCVGATTRDEYRATIERSVQFLEGRYDALGRDLRREMLLASEALDYERAGLLRDRVTAIERTTDRQEVHAYKGDDFDALGVALAEGDAAVQLLRVRDGTIVGRDHFFLEGAEGATPGEVHVPQRGKKRRLIDLAVRNAQDALEQERVRWLADKGKTDTALAELQNALGLEGPPKRIECFDVSHVQGTNVVSSMVVFEDGRPAKQGYRRFRTKLGDRNDDFANMRDTLRRRFARSAAGENDGWPVPDLVILDGGKGQLAEGVGALSDAGLLQIPIAALAKEREELFVPGKPDPIVLPQRSQGLFLVQRIRDEAHRFAVTYHQQLRGKRAIKSILDEIQGVGPAKKRALLRKFGSVKGMRDATEADLAGVTGVGPALAERIKQAID